MSNQIKGYIYAFLGIAFWGIAGPIAKLLFAKNFDSFLVIQTRSTFSFLILLGILLISRKQKLKMKGSDIKYYFILGVIGMAGSNYFYYTSMKYVPVVTAIMIQYTTPFIVLIYSIFRRNEEFHYYKFLLLIIAFVSLFFAITGGNLNYFGANLIGVIISIGGALTWSFFNVYNKSIKNRYNGMVETLYIFGSAAIFWFTLNPKIIFQLFEFSLKDIGVLLLFAMISVLIPMLFYNTGLKYLRATQATTIGLCEPIFVIFVGFIVLNESISLIQGISTAIVLTSIFLLEEFRNRTELNENRKKNY